MNEGLAYWAPPEENPNFVSRAPDPGPLNLFKTVGWEALYHSPFYATKRFSELTLENNSYFNVAGRVLDPEEANQKYGLGGQLKFDEPIKEEAAQLMHRRKVDEIDRAYLISSGQTTGMRQAGSFAVSMAATLIDPINFASMFLPVVGEARIARFAQQFKGVATQRLARGALMGTTGAAMVEPLILFPALQEQANYGLKDSAMNLGFGAALGGFLHAGLGAVADRIRRMQPKDADVIFEAAMNNVLRDESVTAPARVAEFVDELNVPDPSDTVAYAHWYYDGQPGEVTFLHATKDVQGLVASGKFTDSGSGIGLTKGESPDTVFLATDENTASGYLGILNQRQERGAGYANPGLVQVTVKKGAGILEGAEVRVRPEDVISIKPVDPAAGSSSKPTIDDIPKRDEKGRFLSKEKRLELLDKKIREELQAKQDNGPQKVLRDTKEISPREPMDDLGMTGESAKDIQTIESHIAEVEKALDMTPEEKTRLQEDIKAEVGDHAGREKGIIQGIACIIKNLV
jgi:hypothetical protein